MNKIDELKKIAAQRRADAVTMITRAKTGHTGTWEKTATNVTSDVTIAAVYTANKYDYTIETYIMGTDGQYDETSPTKTETKQAKNLSMT